MPTLSRHMKPTKPTTTTKKNPSLVLNLEDQTMQYMIYEICAPEDRKSNADALLLAKVIL